MPTSHQGNNYCPLRLIFASTKSQTSGIKLRWDLKKPIASVMAIMSEVFGGYFEEIDVVDPAFLILSLTNPNHCHQPAPGSAGSMGQLSVCCGWVWYVPPATLSNSSSDRVWFWRCWRCAFKSSMVIANPAAFAIATGSAPSALSCSCSEGSAWTLAKNAFSCSSDNFLVGSLFLMYSPI